MVMVRKRYNPVLLTIATVCSFTMHLEKRATAFNHFNSLTEVREKTEEWMTDYNYHRPHQALNFKSPADLL